MPDILPVRMQNFLYSRKPELREQISQLCRNAVSSGVKSAAYSYEQIRKDFSKMSLIHRYQSNGYNIVLDINSGCIHLVDEVTYEVLPYMEEGLGAEAIVEKLERSVYRGRY